jgi:putative FmdB family regulatory protein
MPTYEYRRPDGTTFEVFQKISADPLTVDPDTGEPVQRVISGGAGLQFKGTGFYLTDYTSKGKEPAKKVPPKNETTSTEKKASGTDKASPAASSSPAPSSTD